MTRQQIHIKVHYYLAILIAFSLPLAQLTPFFISLMCLNWVIEGDFKNKFNLILKNKIALLFISFYSIHLLGIIFTQNMDEGMFDLQVKLSILVFPVLIASRPFTNSQVRNFIYALIDGAVLCSLIMLSVAGYYYYNFGANRFYYQDFAILLHPSYLSMYINFAISLLLYNLFNNDNIRFKKFKYWPYFIILFLSFINILLSSKMGLIIMLMVDSCFLIFYIALKKKYLFGIIALFMFGTSVFLSLKLFPEMKHRMSRSVEALTASSDNEADAESTTVRLHIWKAANKVISENILTGVGTGDAKDELMKEYKIRGMTGAIEHDLNAHNEFYQVFVATGIIGFLLLLANLFIPLYFAFKASDIIYVVFLLIIILNFIPESMLETQAGVMFYAFFNSLLCFNSSNNKQQTTNN